MCCHLFVVGSIAYLNDPDGYADWSLYTPSKVRRIEGKRSDKVAAQLLFLSTLLFFSPVLSYYSTLLVSVLFSSIYNLFASLGRKPPFTHSLTHSNCNMLLLIRTFFCFQSNRIIVLYRKKKRNYMRQQTRSGRYPYFIYTYNTCIWINYQHSARFYTVLGTMRNLETEKSATFLYTLSYIYFPLSLFWVYGCVCMLCFLKCWEEMRY